MRLRHHLRTVLRWLDSPPAAPQLPPWEQHPARAAPPRLRVLWTGTQVAPVPVLVREPPTFFDPTR